MNKQKDPCRAWLESYREMRLEVIRLRQKHQSIWDQATNITTHLSPLPRGGGGDRDRILAVLSDADEQTIHMYLDCVARQQEIEQFIDKIPAAESRLILRLRYVELLTWPKITDTLEASGIVYDERTIFRKHGIALNEARKLWKEECKNAE